MAQSKELSSREQEVIQLLLKGNSNKLIASSLGISERTVEFHLKNIFSKLQVSSRMELVLKLGNNTNKVKAENLGESTVAGEREIAEPGHSTVADKGEIVENGDRLNLRNGATSSRAAVSSIGKELRMENVLNSNARNGANTMTFYESIRVCLTKYAEFNGRASVSEFWWFALFVTLVSVALAYFSQTLVNVFSVAMLLPVLAAGSRRLHDSGKSGWWQLLILVPVAGIILVGILWALPPTNTLPDDTLQA
jgi:DNA-binding CsgD family transcriptional regulator